MTEINLHNSHSKTVPKGQQPSDPAAPDPVSDSTRRTDEFFLRVTAAAAQGAEYPAAVWEKLTGEEWALFFRRADQQNLIPLVLDAVWQNPSFQQLDPAFRSACHQRAARIVALQAQRTAEFARVYGRLRAAGLKPIVMKGILCRSLYPVPDYRPSMDEDLLIAPSDFLRCHRELCAAGMVPAVSGMTQEELDESEEIAYGKPGSPLAIELHKKPFPGGQGLLEKMNAVLAHADVRADTVQIGDGLYESFCPTDHFFFLICHALKHFLHSGFGVRQAMDICLYASRCGCEIEWKLVLEECRMVRAERFAAAVLQIGRDTFRMEIPEGYDLSGWKEIRTDSRDLLADLLDAGIFGDSSMSRVHSAGITLHAAESGDGRGRSGLSGILHVLFPPAEALEERYPYLKEKRYLLPRAWVSRILEYRRETSRGSENSAAEAVRIGKKRMELLREYGVVDDNRRTGETD